VRDEVIISIKAKRDTEFIVKSSPHFTMQLQLRYLPAMRGPAWWVEVT